jgi:hypothetical protein
MPTTLNTGDNLFGVAALIVDPTSGAGTHTTIGAALAVAVSGQTIFIRPGTYTENPALVAGVNLTAFGSDSSLNGTGKVIINGTCSFSTAGTVTISGIQLQTNSANLLNVSGSVASIVNLNNCYLNCSNNTGITFSTANTSAQINIENCNGNLGTTGIAYFSDSSTGVMNILNSFFTNTGASTTQSTKSAGRISILSSSLCLFLTYSSSSTNSVLFNSSFNSVENGGILNQTVLTTSGTGTVNCFNSNFGGGTSSGISIGAGTTVAVFNCVITSSNTNAITGAGTINCSGISFPATFSTTINVTTQTNCGTLQGSKNTAPGAGFLGEQIRGAATAVSLSNTTPANITSKTLTPGVWDISATCTSNGSTNATNQCFIAISTTSATLGSLTGDNNANFSLSSNIIGFCTLGIPSYRQVITTNTTYFLVFRADFNAGTCTGNGRISGTRVG